MCLAQSLGRVLPSLSAFQTDLHQKGWHAEEWFGLFFNT